MNVSGSSIAAYYAGNAALALDRQAGRQSQAAAQQQFRRPQPLSEQVLEGELLDKGQSQARLDGERAGGESAPQHEPPLSSAFSTNPAIRHYQTTAQLSGFSSSGPVHQLDIYV
jgi:hypothetical protein